MRITGIFCEIDFFPETTGGYAPPQNAERVVRSITSDGRTMHHDAALPPSQWGMSMHMSIHGCLNIESALASSLMGCMAKQVLPTRRALS
jgi:hypothetical protein